MIADDRRPHCDLQSAIIWKPAFRLIRAVAYRWVVRCICGYMGWENTRPLPAGVYHLIREKYHTKMGRGYGKFSSRNG